MTPAQGLSLFWTVASAFAGEHFQTDPMSLLKSFQGVRCGGRQGGKAGGGRKEVMLSGKELQVYDSTGIAKSGWESSSSSHAVVLEKLLKFF